MPPKFSSLVLAVDSLYDKLQPKPCAWCRAIVSQGDKHKLLALDTSVRSSLGHDVERQLRYVKIVCDYDRPEEERPLFLQGAAWSDADTINSGVMALLDMMSMERNQETILDLTKQGDVIALLTKHTISMVQDVCGQVHEIKRTLIPLNEQLKVLVEAADKPGWLKEDAVVKMVGHFNEQTEMLENGLKGQDHREISEADPRIELG